MMIPEWNGLTLALEALCAIGLLSLAAQPAAAEKKPPVAVVIGPESPPLERFAAEELCGYLEKLFDLHLPPMTAVPESAGALFLLGRPETNPAVKQATTHQPWPPLSDQGLVLRRVPFLGKPALLVGGGSPVATLWAVYELVERWGVRYLLHGDVLPEYAEGREGDREVSPSRRLLPDLDLVLEPWLPVRQWRVINDFAWGPESWGIADYRPVLDQLAKLKFNRIFVSLYPYQPFLHLEIKGLQRQSATLWFNFHYPITDDMVGRELFGDEEEFWNPDLPLHASYQELAAAGEHHVHELMTYAKQRGMQVVMNATLTEFPPEFAPLLPGAQKVHQLGEMGLVPGPETDVDDPALTELATAVLRTTINTYPEVDYIALGMPEFRQWAGGYERAWQALDAKYGVEKVCPLAAILAQAEARTGYPGGAERALQEVKGDIVALYFYDRLISAEVAEAEASARQSRPGSRGFHLPKFIFNSVAEELFPVLARIAPPGSETLNFVDYTPARIVQRREVLRNIPVGSQARNAVECRSERHSANAAGLTTNHVLIYTLHDDNVGVLPQLTTGSLHELTLDLRRYGWAGFSTRYWLIGDHDPCLAYLSKAAWDTRATPEAVYRDQVRAVCGEAVVEDLLTVFREVEAVTVGLEWHGLGLTFPVPGMMMKHWTPEPTPAELLEGRNGYQRALEAARRAQAQVRRQPRSVSGMASSYVDYWVGRLEFGIGYLDTMEAVRRAATAEAGKNPEEARQHAETALATAQRALEAYARVARDRSDLGAIAVLNEYVYRPLRAKVR